MQDRRGEGEHTWVLSYHILSRMCCPSQRDSTTKIGKYCLDTACEEKKKIQRNTSASLLPSLWSLLLWCCFVVVVILVIVVVLVGGVVDNPHVCPPACTIFEIYCLDWSMYLIWCKYEVYICTHSKWMPSQNQGSNAKTETNLFILCPLPIVLLWFGHCAMHFLWDPLSDSFNALNTVRIDAISQNGHKSATEGCKQKLE